MIKVNGGLLKINTKKKQDGSCIFLNSGRGCILGEDRPFVCKIYPFWINKNQIIYEPGEKEYCFMGKMGMSILEVEKEINEDNKKIRNHFSNIKRDCLENKNKHKKIILELLRKDTDKT